MTLLPRKQTIAIHLLPNILRDEGKQTMRFGQLLEYSMIFLNFIFWLTLLLEKLGTMRIVVVC